ncbi:MULTISPECIES: putative 2-aminoethylphosphonate ABC transporter ATP-binding protein [Deefgea]|uniref:2-aminoethylphosphonate ABC transporter ATP-binding protein n=1 Tax=Deefgea chitinilytica TaxID=570276 RepID=A0ABS2CAX5_9NEIS|nr:MULTISPECIES: putative 2-aminoethylphosphonate ABC transporter ATP-binding protein [Deefgea]MBM5571303.1 putative 2-aminoethylphosphonate ABC transporter ATP-binding protein [Deefgea chitinilytica]MBM9888535.1 putative 2-aminoethylphosphonate ABC transporter ATP-binding protein [Deefgea sp. CFH1-16]
MIRESTTNLNITTELSIAGIQKQFGSFTALRDISLNVQKGEFVCLLGPSGCGKTTLLRIIAGLETADSGTIVQTGCDITKASAAERDYGIVFQSYALFPNLSVAQNIAYGLKGRAQDKARRVTELLTLIGLPAIADKYPAQLSGGQQQRVALARALATSPNLLLLDEPLSALDAQVREHLRTEIKALQQKLGVTTIMVTHDQEEALTMADRIVVMNHGVIEQIGTPTEIYQHPASRFVADFVGHCNWLTAHAVSEHRVRLGESELEISHSTRLKPGHECELFIRPEDIQLLPNWRAGEQLALGKLLHMELIGCVYRLRLSVALWAGVELEVVISHRELAQLRLGDGQLIPVYLPPDKLRCFMPERAA